MRSVVVALVVLAGATAPDSLTPKLADAFARKIVAVQAQADQKAPKDRATTFTQAETNSYLKFQAGDLLPTGLTQPEITMLGGGKVAGRAVVDLDIVRQKQSRGSLFDPTSYLTGQLLVSVAGRIVTADGKGRFELDTADVSGVPIPKAFLGQMVNFFTRTASNPRGSTIDDTFELPARITRIDVAAGSFTLHQ